MWGLSFYDFSKTDHPLKKLPHNLHKAFLNTNDLVIDKIPLTRNKKPPTMSGV